MPNGVAVSKRGGPQPAETAESVVRRSVARATAGAARRAVRNATAPVPPPSIEEVLGLNTPAPGGAVITATPTPTPMIQGLTRPVAAATSSMATDAISAATPGGWKPTGQDLLRYLENYTPATAGEAGPDLSLWQTPGKLDVILAAAQTPSQLADALGVSTLGLTPLLNTVAAGNQMTADATAANAQDAAIARSQTERAFDGPARGGMTPDAIDRPATSSDQSVANAFSMLTLDPAGMDGDQIQALISRLDAEGSTQRAMMLNEAKRQVMEDTAMAMADSQRLAEVYRAGVEGRPMPDIPMPGESTAQGRYTTASRSAAQVANPTVVAPTLDTKAAEQRILMAAKGIEFQRIQEQRQSVLDLLKSQQEDAVAAQKAAEAEQKRQEKEVARGEAAIERDAVDAKLRTKFGQDLAGDAISNLGGTLVFTEGGTTKVSDADAKSAFNTAKKWFESGGSYREVVRHVFPDSVDEMGDPKLTPGQLKVLQAAQFAAGKTPDELATAWNDYRDAGRVHFGFGVS